MSDSFKPKCPNCGHPLTAKVTEEKSSVTCPKCGESIPVFVKGASKIDKKINKSTSDFGKKLKKISRH